MTHYKRQIVPLIHYAIRQIGRNNPEYPMTTSKSIAVTTAEQQRAFADARELVIEDADTDLCDPDRADRGPAAGDIPDGEVVRILAEAYLGEL